MSEIKLGCIAVEQASGVEGTVISMMETFNGNVQYAIQPKTGKDNKMPEAWNFDRALVKYKAKGISDQATPAQATDVQVGDEVEDIISGHKGIAASKTTFINGCVYFDVQSKGNPAKKIEATAMFISCTRLKKTSKATLKPIMPKGEKPTGGPSSRAMRAN
jgi:hypothetical protein